MSRRHFEGGRSCPGTVAGVLGERCGLAAARWKVAEAAVRLHRSAASATQPHARGQLFKIDCRDWGVLLSMRLSVSPAASLLLVRAGLTVHQCESSFALPLAISQTRAAT